eukprot:2710170-Pyramimonas_sp.AAC.1
MGSAEYGSEEVPWPRRASATKRSPETLRLRSGTEGQSPSRAQRPSARRLGCTTVALGQGGTHTQ